MTAATTPKPRRLLAVAATRRRSTSDVDELLRIQDVLRDVLREASSRRSERPGWDHDRHEPEWVAYERAALTWEVDRMRASKGLPPVDPSLIEQAERSAVGHLDYAQKYALRCAEAALDLTHLAQVVPVAPR